MKEHGKGGLREVQCFNVKIPSRCRWAVRKLFNPEGDAGVRGAIHQDREHSQ